MIDVRKSVMVLSVSAACISGIFVREGGYVEEATRPLPGDRCTYGYGSTFHEDGSPVLCSEKIAEPEARRLAEGQIKNKYEAGIRKCTPDLKLYQREWDFLTDSAYNLGVKAVCNSGMVREFRKGNFEAGCAYILKYKFYQDKDCTIKANKCGGIPIDRERAYKMCMGENHVSAGG